jgi:WD40 repeat protein
MNANHQSPGLPLEAQTALWPRGAAFTTPASHGGPSARSERERTHRASRILADLALRIRRLAGVLKPHNAWRQSPATLARVVALTTVALAGLTARADVAVEPLLKLGEPTENFNDVAYTPDGQHLLSSIWGECFDTFQGTGIALWNLRTGQKVREFEGGTGPVAVSANGQWALTGSEANIAILWDLETGELIRTFAGHTNTITAVAFSPDGRQMLTASSDATVNLWGTEDGELHYTLLLTDPVVSAVYSPDGQYVLTGHAVEWDPSGRGGSPSLWDAQTGELVRTFEQADGKAGFAMNGRFVLALETETTRLSLWNIQTAQPIPLHACTGWGSYRFTISPDGRLAFLHGAQKGGRPRLVELASDRIVRSFMAGGCSGATCAAFSPDGRRLIIGASCTCDTTTLWDLGDLLDWLQEQWHVPDVVHQYLRTFGYGSLHDLALLPDGQRFVTVGSQGVWLRDFESGEVLQSFPHTNEIMSVAVTLDGKTIAIGSGDGAYGGDCQVRILDATSLQLRHVLSGHGGRVGGLAFSPDGNLLVSGSGDHTASLWDVGTGHLLRVFSGHEGEVKCVAFSSNGGRLLTAGAYDGTVRLWNTETGELRRTFRDFGPQPYVWSVAFSNDGTEVVAGTEGMVRIWELETGVLKRSIQTGGSWTPSLAFSRDGTQLVTGHYDGTTRLWDVTTGQLQHSFPGNTGGLDTVWCAVFAGDESRIVAGTWEGDVRIWDAATGDLLRLFPHSPDRPPFMFSADGQALLTQGADGGGRLWNTWDHQMVQTFPSYVDALLADQFVGLYASTNSPDHRRELNCRDYSGISVVESDSGRVLRRLDHVEDYYGYVPSFSPDGRFIAKGGYSVQLFDAEAGQLLRTFAGHPDHVESVAFSPDGLLLLTTDMWDTTRVWDLRDLVVGLRIASGTQGPEARWERGRLQWADSVTGPWEDPPNAVSPFPMDRSTGLKLYRVKLYE